MQMGCASSYRTIPVEEEIRDRLKEYKDISGLSWSDFASELLKLLEENVQSRKDFFLLNEKLNGGVILE